MAHPDYRPLLGKFRPATMADLDRIAEVYEKHLDREDETGFHNGWARGVYPTKDTARPAIELGEMFVLEVDGTIVGSARINHEQPPAYADCKWENEAPAEEIMIMHTLVVDPAYRGKGYGWAFLMFYENYALDHGCPYLRIDTFVMNKPALSRYLRMGYRNAGEIPCEFNGIPGMVLVCLEKKAERR